ncbi:hypothetical protein V493_04337 [Pseudogymnoascus sp. VKM F-4281 (FW-2241)]|nr:hypothetical protein V493_04337 [Pseudogymnoascus sp. VKM F-4281 (FW-2241)]
MADTSEPRTTAASQFRNQGTMQDPRKRNRTGCLTCRQRKKRCDGVREKCGHCSRLNLVCHWQTPQDIITKPRARSFSPTELYQLDESLSALPLPKLPNPTNFLESEYSQSAQRSASRKLALRYYIQSFTPMLTTNLENNGFLSVLLPMAIEDKLLLDMLIAWSSSHLSLCDDEHRARALEHRSTALNSFASSLSDIYHSPALLLAGCLVFCSMSAILGDTTGWHHHLLGAVQIIHNAGTSSPGRDGVAVMSSSYEGRWLLRNFAYHDILMSITLDREPLIPGKYWIPEPRTPIDSYFGLASDPMAMLSKISSLNGEMRRSMSASGPGISHTPDSGSPDSSTRETFDFSALARSIETELREWKCAESTDVCLVSLGEAYRSAALIYLYRVIRRNIPGTRTQVDKKIANQASAVVQHVGNMPMGCLPECTSLFPLFMAGGETTSRPEMLFIRERLQHLVTYRHFQNAASALSILEELWLQHTNFSGLVAGEPLDWIDVLSRRGWKLALS